MLLFKVSDNQIMELVTKKKSNLLLVTLQELMLQTLSQNLEQSTIVYKMLLMDGKLHKLLMFGESLQLFKIQDQQLVFKLTSNFQNQVLQLPMD